MTKDRGSRRIGGALAFIGSAVGGVAASAVAATISVPGESATIQAGILAAAPGDTVLVAPGSYRELIHMKNGIVLRSAAGPDSTILESPGLAESILDERLLECVGGIDRSTVIEGFTFDGAGIRGAGIWCEGASPVIRGNVIRDFGWGLNLREGSDALVEDNVIRGCTPFGVMIFASSPELRRNEILENRDRGIAIAGKNSKPVIGGRAEYANRIVGNDFAIVNDSRNDIDATYNEWGWVATIEMDRADYPADVSVIIDGNDRGDTRKGRGSVDYRRWRQPKKPDPTPQAPDTTSTAESTGTASSPEGEEAGTPVGPGASGPTAPAAGSPRWVVPVLVAAGLVLLFVIVSRRPRK